jgi:aminoglycoside phosphotransferase (APT) family kinase protein
MTGGEETSSKRASDEGGEWLPEIKWDDPELNALIESIGGEAFDNLITRLFPGYREVKIRPLGQGISGAKVFRAEARSWVGWEAETVIKIGLVDDLKREAERWEIFARRSLRYRPDLFPKPELTEAGKSALVYMLVGGETLGERIRSLVFRDRDIDGAVRLVHKLMDDLKVWHKDRHTDCRAASIDDYRLEQDCLSGFRRKCDEFASTEDLPAIEANERILNWNTYRGYEKTQSCICHGDLHANNVLIGRDNELLPIDFSATGRGHFLRDFTKFETDLVFRVLAPRDRRSQHDEVRAYSELQAGFCSPKTFGGLSGADSHWDSANAARDLMVFLRTLALSRMDQKERQRDIEWYLLGVLRHAVRMTERPDSGLSPTQRWLAACAANSIAEHILPSAEHGSRSQPDCGPGEIGGSSTGHRKAREQVEGLLHRMRKRVVFEPLLKPLLVDSTSSVINVKPFRKCVQLRLPDEKTRQKLMRQVLDDDPRLQADTEHYRDKYRFLSEERLGQKGRPDDAKFQLAEDLIPHDTDDKWWSTIDCLRKTTKLQQAREDNVSDFLRAKGVVTSKPGSFLFNGYTCCLSDLKLEDEGVALTLRQSDYYTYRAIADCSKEEILPHCGLEERLNNGLRAYCAEGVQEAIHGGFGTLEIVHCLRDKPSTVVLRRRSKRGADFDDAGKWSSTTNETVFSSHKCDVDGKTGQLRPAMEWVRRALKAELLGNALEVGDIQLHACFFTGVLLYKPNLTFNLSFLVSLDCTAEDLLRHVPLSSGAINEYDEARVVPFTPHDLNEFLAGTTTGEDLSLEWDEGGLAAVLMALPLAGKLP